MYIYELIKLSNNNTMNDSMLTKYIINKPQSLFIRKLYFTPFIYAACLNLNTLKKLYSIYVDNKDNINSVFIDPYEFTNVNGYNLLHFVVKMLFKYKYEKPDKLLLKQYDEILHYIITIMNVNINSINNKGNTILHIAAENNSLDYIKTFIYYDVRINKQNFNKETALTIAYKHLNKNIFKYLLYKKADYHVLNDVNDDKFKELIDEYKLYYSKKIIYSKKTESFQYKELKKLYILLYNLCIFYNINETDKYKLRYKNQNKEIHIYDQLITFNNNEIEFNKKYFLHYYLNNQYDDVYDNDNVYDNVYNDDDNNDDNDDLNLTNFNDYSDNDSIDNIFHQIFDDEFNVKDNDILHNILYTTINRSKCLFNLNDIFDDNINFMIKSNIKKRINSIIHIKNMNNYTIYDISNIILHQIISYV